MKNIGLILIVLILISCSKVKEETIIGEWQVTHFEKVSIITDLQTNTSEVFEQKWEYPYLFETSYFHGTFTTSDTFRISSYTCELKSNGTYLLKGELVPINDYVPIYKQETGTWYIPNKKTLEMTLDQLGHLILKSNSIEKDKIILSGTSTIEWGTDQATEIYDLTLER